MVAENAFDSFQKTLRSALNHLYDPDYLRTCGLAALLGLAGQFNTPKLVQEILIQAIEAIHHRNEGERSERKGFYHDLLYYRYVQKLSQVEVASQLGLSPRQFAREQVHAIALLAMVLTEDYPILERAWDHPGATAGTEYPFQADDLDWLGTGPASQPVSLPVELDTVLGLVSSLADRHQIEIVTSLDTPIAELEIHPVALRQALLSVISVAIHQAGKLKVVIKAQQVETDVQVQISAEKNGDEPQDESQEDRSSLEMAHQLVEKYKGRLDNDTTTAEFCARLSMLPYQRQVVLLVDDNLDFHQLVQRFTFGTRYQVVSTKDSSQVVELALKHNAQLILLDVMMPEIDGWQVLGRLRRHPQTGHIPVIICTIVAQEELAYSLGASAFLRKPVTREALLTVLNHSLASAD